MNFENRKASDPHRLLLNLTDKIDFSRKDIALSNLSICYTWKNIKMSYENNKFEISPPTIGIYINKIENRITFKIKTGYHLELLTPETMKLFGSTKRKITKNENGEMFFI